MRACPSPAGEGEGGGRLARAEAAEPSGPAGDRFGRRRGRLVEQGRQLAFQRRVGLGADRVEGRRDRVEAVHHALAQQRADDAPEVQSEIGIDFADGD